jgi:hypothetical protein
VYADVSRPDRVALQPESRREERALDRLFSRLQDCRFRALSTFYTFDVPDYEQLDGDLARRTAVAERVGLRSPVVNADGGWRGSRVPSRGTGRTCRSTRRKGVQW